MSSITLVRVSVRGTYYQLSCDKMAFYSRPFENVEVCLNRGDTQFLGELLHVLMTSKGIFAKTVNGHITKGKPRAARFAV